MDNLVIYRGVVGSRLGHGWGTRHGWGKVGAWLGQARLGQGSGMVGAQGMLGARLGHGWGQGC